MLQTQKKKTACQGILLSDRCLRCPTGSAPDGTPSWQASAPMQGPAPTHAGDQPCDFLAVSTAAVNSTSVDEFSAVSVESCNTLSTKPTATTCIAT